MGNYVTAQLVTFALAALLGAVCGVVYDLLRSVRLLRRRSVLLTHMLDGVYVTLVPLAVFLFALGRGEGELRLYMLLAMVLGAVFYFGALSAWLRPLWEFWASAAAAFLALLWKPLGITARAGKNFLIYIKKFFHFLCKCATIGK